MNSFPNLATPQPSVTDNQFYQFLYSSNFKAILDFLLFAKPISNEEFEANEQAMQIILSKEPRDRANYKKVATVMRDIRSNDALSLNSTHKIVLSYFDYLLGLRDSWKNAAVDFWNYDLYRNMIKAAFVDQNSDQLLFYVNFLDTEDLELYKANCNFFNQPRQIAIVDDKWRESQRFYIAVQTELTCFKKKWDMKKRIDILVDLMKANERQKDFIQKYNIQTALNRQQKKEAVRAENKNSVTRQMGQLGNQDIGQTMLHVLEEIHQQHQKQFFTFAETDCVTKPHEQDTTNETGYDHNVGLFKIPDVKRL